MAHTHDHTHHHHHHHEASLTRVSRALWIAVLCNALFVLVEAVAGLIVQSLALLTDAGHNLGDVVGLAMSLLAFRLASIKPNEHYTYGYRKSTILVALMNAMILLIAVGSIGFEAVHRLLHPEPLQGGTVAIVAGIGIVINGATALLFLKDKEKDLNIRGAYLHMAADALVSLGVVIAGIVIMLTHWYWLDSVISFGIMTVIVIGTWSLLTESLRLSLDGVPKNIDVQEVARALQQVSGVKGVHHIHVWAISTTENALTAHIVVEQTTSLKDTFHIRHELEHAMEDINIRHSTFELEAGEEICDKKACEVHG